MVGGGGLGQFSVSPKPLDFGFGAKVLGPGLDNIMKNLMKIKILPTASPLLHNMQGPHQ